MTTERKKHHPIRRAKTERVRPSKNQSSEKEVDLQLEPRRERRALSHVGGSVSFRGGSPQEHQVLAHALAVSPEEEDVMQDVHGFHSYPARLHPITARRLIEGFSQAGGRIMDPFCGSGTVVVEGRALGRHAIGSDLNPLAVELSWLKSRGPTQKLVTDMVNAAAHIAEVAEERRFAKADPYRLYDPEDRERYPVHVLLELDSVAHGIGQLSGSEVTRMLRLVVSSMLTKLAHSEGDTTRRRAPRRLPAGFAIRLFEEKTQELAERLEAYRFRLPEKAPRAYVTSADARELEHVESDSIDLIVTSPPYPGVYDYLEHHMHRIRWLGLKEHRLREGEIGARREYRRLRLEDAAARWREEIGPTLYELRRTLANDGRGVLVIADSVADRQALRADELIQAVAERAGVDITCIASQERPLFLHGADRAFSGRPRMEHVVLFRPSRQVPKPRKTQTREGAEEDRERPERFRRSGETSASFRSPSDAPPRRRFEGDRPSGAARGRGDGERGPSRDEDRTERSFPRRAGGFSPSRPSGGEGTAPRRSFRDKPAAAGGSARSDAPEAPRQERDNQRSTWDSSPRGPGRPRSKSARKPK